MKPSLVFLGVFSLICGAPACQSAAPAPAAPSGSGSTVAIVGATVIHPGPTARVDRDMTVLVQGERIATVGPATSVAVPPGALRIDARGKWVVPGIIDTHVHFFQSGGPYTRPDIVDLTKSIPYAQEAASIREHLGATFASWISCGVTSVADMGGPFWNFEVRERAAATERAPRVFVAGPLLSMVDRQKLDLGIGDPPIIKVTNAEEAVALARRQLEKKPDFVKVWFIYDPKKDDLAAQEAIVRAVADVSHAAGVRLAVHATSLAPAKAALRAKADILVHSVDDAPLDDEFMALARERHVLYTPTLIVYGGYARALLNRWHATDADRALGDPKAVHDLEAGIVPEDALPAASRARLETRLLPVPFAVENLRRARDAGITITVGTDAGNIGTLHGPSVFSEMAAMAAAGLSPAEVLTAATANGAVYVGRSADLGDVAAGKLADLVVLDADPLDSVAHWSRTYRVLKGGKVFDPRELRSER